LLREQMQKAVELEKIVRDEALALAEQERQTHVIEAEIVRLNASRAQIEADLERERALQEAMTVTEKIAAEREAEIDIIDARLEADKRIIGRSEIEIETMREQEMADAERSALAQAETIRTRAEAELDATKMSALGERERQRRRFSRGTGCERVKVVLKEAEAIRQKLLAEAEGEKAKAEALASHDAVAKELELARLSAETLKAIEIARAQALGQAIEGMNMSVIGDASTAHRLLQLIATAQSVQPIYDALPAAARETLGHLAGRLAGRQASTGRADLSGLYTLILSLEQEQPGLLDDDLTFGQAAAILLEHKGNTQGGIYDNLRDFGVDPDLKDLPFKSVLALITRAAGIE
jgi:hypothetical protein